MAHFRSATGSFAPGPGPISVNVPTTGQTYTMSSSERSVYFNHAATIATLTVKLPPPGDSGDVVSLKFRSVVTTLTLRDINGAAIPSAPVTTVLGQAVEMRWVDNTVGWMWW